MLIHSLGLLRQMTRLLLSGLIGAGIVLVIVFIVYLNNQADLDVWHTAYLDREFTAESDIRNFEEYLENEDALFKQLDTLVYDKIESEERDPINRFDRSSKSYPGRWPRNWNRSFEFAASKPAAGVLLLHGMSDSPYSLRAIGQDLNRAGAWVVGLRMPGHGTAPSGMVTLKWQDMSAATRLAMKHLKTKVPDGPIHVIGYSTGGALAVKYALDTLDEPQLPKVAKLVLISPAIGVSPAAALAVWQGRIGHLLGLEKLAWTDILPEYDPFKYNSFAVNAGDVVYRLTQQINAGFKKHDSDELGKFPQVLAFQSIVDATVSVPALVTGLFQKLPAAGHELVLFGIDRRFVAKQLLKQDPLVQVEKIIEQGSRGFDISFLTNKDSRSRNLVIMKSKVDGGETVESTALFWPKGIYSLSHVALPFTPDDPLYGGRAKATGNRIQLGNITVKGERGILKISAANRLRLRWNPFSAYLRKRINGFTGLESSGVMRPKQRRSGPMHRQGSLSGSAKSDRYALPFVRVAGY